MVRIVNANQLQRGERMSMKGYKTYLASGGLALLAILHAILSDPSVANWLAAGRELLIAAAIAACGR